VARLALILLAAGLAGPAPATAGVADPVLVAGPQKILVVAVRFPGTEPSQTLPQIEQKVDQVGGYIRMASYGKAWLEPRLTGWYEMPAPLAEYRVSPFNYKVDRGRVRRLVADALTAARQDTDPNAYRCVWIVVGVRTRPGEGYGMIAYAANPGMLSGVVRSRGRKARLESVELPGGGSFAGPAIVSAENAHVGHAAHDLLHALGGEKDGSRAVPDLYDFDLQSDPRVEHTSPAPFAIHAGPWDIMSQHFIERRQPPPPPSSFTRLQLGWIEPGQVASVRPGETREVALKPLAQGKGLLVVRVPIDAHRSLLVENRQRVGGDAGLPSAGLLVLQIDTAREEGAGIVVVADANPGVAGLQAAPFVPGAGERRSYQSKRDGVAVAPLALESDGTLRLVVTTPERLPDFVPGDRR
jgi:M6 family metalloprotease-like protein